MRQRLGSGALVVRGAVAAGAGALMVSGIYQLVPEVRHGLRRRRSRTPRVLVREWLAASASSMIRPAGFVVPSRGPGRARPVVLVHGYGMSASGFALLARRLARAGIGPIERYEYWSLSSVDRAARGLDRRIAELCAHHRTDVVDVIGHSLGGLVARYSLTVGDSRDRIATLVTLATPHQGTAVARYAVGGAARDMRVGSDLLQRLAVTPVPDAARAVALWSRADSVVDPPAAARWPLAEEITYDDLGHVSMLASRRVASDVVALLRR